MSAGHPQDDEVGNLFTTLFDAPDRGICLRSGFDLGEIEVVTLRGSDLSGVTLEQGCRVLGRHQVCGDMRKRQEK